MANIAVIEDNKTIAFLIEALLEAQKHRVSIYSDGTSGLHGMCENSPDLLILDVGLPDISGFEVAERMHDDVALADIPILILTALQDVNSRVRGLQVADDYLSKPFNKQELIARVDALLRRSSNSGGLKGRLELIGGAGAAVQVVALVHPKGALIFDDGTVVYFSQGRVIDIIQRDKTLSAEEAVTEAFSRHEGGFRFEPGAQLPQAILNLDPMRVLLEAARVNDEAAEAKEKQRQHLNNATQVSYDDKLDDTIDMSYGYVNNVLNDKLNSERAGVQYRHADGKQSDGKQSDGNYADSSVSTHTEATGQATPTNTGAYDVKGEAIQHELLELVHVDDTEKALLAALQDAASAASAEMVRAFYDRLFAHDNTKEYFAGVSMTRLHGMISTWFVELFSGNYDSKYVSKRIEIGQIHVRIGLPVRYPLAMLDIVSKYGLEVALKSDQAEAAKAAFLKILSLDVAIFNQAYEDDKLHHLAELVGGERLARLLLSGITHHQQ
ncbi:MAG: protoglobin domain-containing protein [Deinococcota bacterium]